MAQVSEPLPTKSNASNAVMAQEQPEQMEPPAQQQIAVAQPAQPIQRAQAMQVLPVIAPAPAVQHVQPVNTQYATLVNVPSPTHAAHVPEQMQAVHVSQPLHQTHSLPYLQAHHVPATHILPHQIHLPYATPTHAHPIAVPIQHHSQQGVQPAYHATPMPGTQLVHISPTQPQQTQGLLHTPPLVPKALSHVQMHSPMPIQMQSIEDTSPHVANSNPATAVTSHNDSQVNSQTDAQVNSQTEQTVLAPELVEQSASQEIPDENTPPMDNIPPEIRASPKKDCQPIDIDKISKLVLQLKASSADRERARPLICQDITNSNADTLRISRLPRSITYDRIFKMVEPFGEVEDLTWSASDPYVCDVTYTEAAAAHEAKHFLGDALVGNDSEPPLKAELRSRDPGAQLFVGDLTPDVTEEMLEAAFSELVGEPVSALLKRDPESFSPIGYGFLSFKSESSANFALVAGHRVKIGNACVRVGRAERNTYLYVSDLSPNVSMDELKNLFGNFGSLVDEDTVIVRRSYAFVRYKNRNAAEKAKRTLDKTDLKGRLSVRYAEAEPLKACVAVQFHSSVPRPPNSLRDLLTATFSKHGNCTVQIPRLGNGMWRKVAFVTFHGEPIAANMAALEAVQSVRFVSSLPVCCQFARELIPRFPSRGLNIERSGGLAVEKMEQSSGPDRPRNFITRKNAARRAEQAVNSRVARSTQAGYDPRRHFNGENGGQQNTPDFVPVYVPVTALHPSQQMHGAPVNGSEADFSGFHWQNRMMIANGNPPPNMNQIPPHVNYNGFAPIQDRMMRW